MDLRIIVCIKQVPDIEGIRIYKENKKLVVENPHKIINTDDAHALEEALRIKDQYADTHITAVALGPPEAKDALLECLALGADDAVLITGNESEYSDTLITAEILSAAIEKLGEFDLIFAGNQATGGDTGQVGPQLAEKLRIPQITCVSNLKVEQNKKLLTAEKVMEDKYVTIRTNMPCLLTATKELNKPRTMSLGGILAANKKEIKMWKAEDLTASLNNIGMKIPPTRIVRTFIHSHDKICRFITEETEEEIVQKLLKEIQVL